jgi:hypothetical protein
VARATSDRRVRGFVEYRAELHPHERRSTTWAATTTVGPQVLPQAPMSSADVKRRCVKRRPGTGTVPGSVVQLPDAATGATVSTVSRVSWRDKSPRKEGSWQDLC